MLSWVCDNWVLNYNLYVRWNGESLRESIKRHEHFLALQLGLKPGMKVSFLLKSVAQLFAALSITERCVLFI
jgi:hypothetical protein